ncbi:transporter substrate-binding domain-containing protein [Galbibacter sp. BG1]|uniref:transporter substrate-binding domain-containing protein n=1 Tax=Galbibacter sp. BG1 TaxID=1170699 RepID=UPI0015C0E6FD|nr:transporter substrate-binding domain-containing protein [Galbibacter sp. BG1]QLE01195.1 transporter substrate-binding domain-containing protein [Galbibacter sp. BG1]
MHRIQLCCLLFLAFQLQLFAQVPKDSILKVGYTGSAPFVLNEDIPNGISIDVWKEIAFKTNLNYDLVPFTNIDNGIIAVKNNKIDVLIGPITINSERAEQISFSQPYFDTEMAILAPNIDLSIWERIKPFFSSTFLYAVLGLFLVLGIVGFLFWLVEGRYRKSDFGKSPIKGIGNGIWLAIVTMTTVGYGDYAPRTALGRFIIGAWMIISLIMATSFVAGIATTLTVTSKEGKTITSLPQLEGKRVAVPPYNKLIDNVNIVGGEPVIVENVKDGYRMLLNNEVDALVYDVIPLEYAFKAREKNKFVLSKKNILPQHYGFIFPEANALEKQIDIAILKLKEDDAINKIIDSWINRN